MLDSNAFDKLLLVDDAIDVLNDLTQRGRLVILTTHVQRDELTETPEPRRTELLAAYDRLVMSEVPTAGAIFGVSKFGQAKFGDGGTDPDSLRIGDIMTTNPKDAEDALIAVTAGAEVDVFITEEIGKFPNRIKRKTDRPEVLNVAQFLERVRSLR
jgi:hypothetical protein